MCSSEPIKIIYFVDSTPYDFYFVRLVTFIPGETFYGKPVQPRTVYNIGKFLGRLHNTLEVSNA